MLVFLNADKHLGKIIECKKHNHGQVISMSSHKAPSTRASAFMAVIKRWFCNYSPVWSCIWTAEYPTLAFTVFQTTRQNSVTASLLKLKENIVQCSIVSSVCFKVKGCWEGWTLLAVYALFPYMGSLLVSEIQCFCSQMISLKADGCFTSS